MAYADPCPGYRIPKPIPPELLALEDCESPRNWGIHDGRPKLLDYGRVTLGNCRYFFEKLRFDR